MLHQTSQQLRETKKQSFRGLAEQTRDTGCGEAVRESALNLSLADALDRWML